jgi:hypothetical protein
MIEIDRQIFCDVAEENYMDVREDYSGRGMYGKGCVGVIGSLSQFALFLLALDEAIREQLGEVHNATDAACQLADNLCTDNMGYEIIFYWPSLSLVYDDDADVDYDRD